MSRLSCETQCHSRLRIRPAVWKTNRRLWPISLPGNTEMRIWIVMTGEAIPTDGKNVRLRRAANLAAACASRGDDVTWLKSRFNHQAKLQRGACVKRINTDEVVRV